MNRAIELRDKIVELLKRERGYERAAAAEIDGIFFAAAELAVPDGGGNHQVFRISVVPYERQYDNRI